MESDLRITKKAGFRGVCVGPAFLGVQVSLALPDPEHLGATYGTDTLSSRLAVLHGYSPGIPHFPLGTAFHAISLHSLPPFFYEA